MSQGECEEQLSFSQEVSVTLSFSEVGGKDPSHPVSCTDSNAILSLSCNYYDSCSSLSFFYSC